MNIPFGQPIPIHQPSDTTLHCGRMGFACKRASQLVEAVLGFDAEGADVAGARRQAGVDLVAVVVVVEQDPDLAGVLDHLQRIERVGGHQIGEVGRAERRRQPQVHFDTGVVERDRPHEAQIGDRLVEFRIGDCRQCCQHVVDDAGPRHHGRHSGTASLAPAATSTWSCPGVGSCSSAGTGRS